MWSVFDNKYVVSAKYDVQFKRSAWGIQICSTAYIQVLTEDKSRLFEGPDISFYPYKLPTPKNPNFFKHITHRCLYHLRLLEEEAAKRVELEQLHLQQQRMLSQTKAEKRELVAIQQAKEKDLKAAMLQLDSLEKERQGALEQYEVRSHVEVYTGLRTAGAFNWEKWKM